MNDQQVIALFYSLNNNGFGGSAKAMTSVILDLEDKRNDVPYDSGDFARCYYIVEAVPYLKANIDKMKAVSVAWELIIQSWDVLGHNLKARNLKQVNVDLDTIHYLAAQRRTTEL